MDMHGDAFWMLVVFDCQVAGVIVRFLLIKELFVRLYRVSLKLPIQLNYKVVIGFLIHDVGDNVESSNALVERLVYHDVLAYHRKVFVEGLKTFAITTDLPHQLEVKSRSKVVDCMFFLNNSLVLRGLGFQPSNDERVDDSLCYPRVSVNFWVLRILHSIAPIEEF